MTFCDQWRICGNGTLKSVLMLKYQQNNGHVWQSRTATTGKKWVRWWWQQQLKWWSLFRDFVRAILNLYWYWFSSRLICYVTYVSHHVIRNMMIKFWPLLAINNDSNSVFVIVRVSLRCICGCSWTFSLMHVWGKHHGMTRSPIWVKCLV